MCLRSEWQDSLKILKYKLVSTDVYNKNVALMHLLYSKSQWEKA